MVRRHHQRPTCFPSLCSATPQELASCSSISPYDSKVFSGVGPISYPNTPCPEEENISFSLCLFLKSRKSFPQTPRGPDLTSQLSELCYMPWPVRHCIIGPDFHQSQAEEMELPLWAQTNQSTSPTGQDCGEDAKPEPSWGFIIKKFGWVAIS